MSNERYSYKIKSYVNASHAIRWENGAGQQHNHTWEIICEITTEDNRMIVFDEIEVLLKEFFFDYSGNFLNDLAPFDKINPTIENVTTHFYRELSEKLMKINATLVRIEVGESPTRFYCITRGQG